MRIIFLILLSMFCISCATKTHPKMLSFTPASVVIDYSDNDLHEATGLAQQFCSSIGKDAQYVRTNEEGWVVKDRHAFFNCIESSRSHNNNQGNNSNMPIINNFSNK